MLMLSNSVRRKSSCLTDKNVECYAIMKRSDEESHLERMNYVTQVVNEFQEQLRERVHRFLGYPATQNCGDYLDAINTFLQFNLNNVGDPFKNYNGFHSKKFEVGVLEWFAQLWGIKKDEYWGYVTNGGTEGNLHGLLQGSVFTERTTAEWDSICISRITHYSLFKIARMYRMQCEAIATLANGGMDCSDLRDKLLINKDKPAIINVTLGTTFKGAIDNLDLVIQTLKDCNFCENNFYIHCDAAILGITIPFLEQASNYTFSKPIGSLSISGHKFLGCPMPRGVVLTRKKYNDTMSDNIEYIASVDNTIAGSRNGHTPMILWYLINMKGHKGIQDEVEECLKNARYLRDCLQNAGISAELNEMSIIVLFERPKDQDFVDRWHLQCLENMAHVSVMPHVNIKILDRFVDDLIQTLKI